MLFSTVNPQKTCQNLENFRAPRGVLFFSDFSFSNLGCGVLFFCNLNPILFGRDYVDGGGGVKLTPW